VQNWYLGTSNHVEEFRLKDGTVLTDVQAQSLVGALAVFNPGGSASSASMPEHRMRPADLSVSAMA
jgi:hypothetical protein